MVCALFCSPPLRPRRICNSFSFKTAVTGDFIDPIDVLALVTLRILSPKDFR